MELLHNPAVFYHVPHAGENVSTDFLKRLLIPYQDLKQEILFQSDRYMDKLIPEGCGCLMKTDTSRMECDMERFMKDEPMEEHGMGILYEKDLCGRKFIEIDDRYRKDHLDFYESYHCTLQNICDMLIDAYGGAILVDLHSFSDAYVKKLFGITVCPDICIGFNDDGTSYPEMNNAVKRFFENNGFFTVFNYPYRGSMIPHDFLGKKDIPFKSIMIEVNKRLYLQKDGITMDSAGMAHMKTMMESFDVLVSCFAGKMTGTKTREKSCSHITVTTTGKHR